jgi:hypothetical protein
MAFHEKSDECLPLLWKSDAMNSWSQLVKYGVIGTGHNFFDRRLYGSVSERTTFACTREASNFARLLHDGLCEHTDLYRCNANDLRVLHFSVRFFTVVADMATGLVFDSPIFLSTAD